MKNSKTEIGERYAIQYDTKSRFSLVFEILCTIVGCDWSYNNINDSTSIVGLDLHDVRRWWKKHKRVHLLTRLEMISILRMGNLSRKRYIKEMQRRKDNE